LRMRRVPAQMRIEKKGPVFHVDRTQTQQALHIGPMLQAAQAFYQQAYQDGLSAIGDIASRGDEMMWIGNNSYSLADIAAQRAMDDQGELNTSMLPPAELQWDPGYFNINWSAHSLEMEWDISTWADIRVEPGYVEIRMAKYPSLVIKVKYDENDKTGGKLVDKYI
jgi:hypothetical protein